MDARQGAHPGELDAVRVGAEPDVVVGVDEAGQDQLAARVDPLGVRAGPGCGLIVRADPDDQAVVDGEGLGRGQVGIDGVDPGSGEQQVGGEGVACHVGVLHWVCGVVQAAGAYAATRRRVRAQ